MIDADGCVTKWMDKKRNTAHKITKKENKMKYKGKELDVFKSDENVAFNPPHQMLVWDRESAEPSVEYVAAFCPSRVNAVIINDGGVYQHCAENPKAKTNWEVYADNVYKQETGQMFVPEMHHHN